jgi:hypothetical protein
MKLKISIILLLMTPALFSIETEFNEIIGTDFDAVWELENTNDATVSAIIDCQSFFHKLDFIHNPSGEIIENFLTTNECQDIYLHVNDCIEKEGYVCIETDDIFNDQCFCGN